MKSLWLCAGPCAVESAAQIEESCTFVAELGLRYIRGGCFKPRTKHTSFQGLGMEGVRLFRAAADRHGLKIVSEIMDTRDAGVAGELIDVVQVGARNMQNFDLLRVVGQLGKPVLLKRGPAATLDEWEGAAGYVLAGGCPELLLCERGHRTYMGHVRYMPDLAAIPLMQARGFQVIFDPSHCAGRRDLVRPLALAALAAGTDGLIVEAHPCPEQALSDAAQQLSHSELRGLCQEITELSFRK